MNDRQFHQARVKKKPNQQSAKQKVPARQKHPDNHQQNDTPSNEISSRDNANSSTRHVRGRGEKDLASRHVSVSTATTLKSGLAFSDTSNTFLSDAEQTNRSRGIQQVDVAGSENIVYLQYMADHGWGVLVSTGGVMLLLNDGSRLCLSSDASFVEYVTAEGDISRFVKGAYN